MAVRVSDYGNAAGRDNAEPASTVASAEIPSDSAQGPAPFRTRPLLYHNRALLFWFILAGAITGLLYAIATPKYYRSEIVIAPVSESSPTGAVAQLAEVANVVGMPGTPFGSTGASTIALGVLRSRSFAAEFVRNHNLVARLRGGALGWKVQHLLNSATWDSRDAAEYFDEHVRAVADDRRSGLVVVSMEWTNSDEAAAWCVAYVHDLNETLRADAEAAAQRNVDYLRTQVESSSLPALQLSMSRLLELEMQKLLVARGKREFAYKTVDAPIAAKRPYSPRKLKATVSGLLLGGLAGFVVALMLSEVRRFKSARGI